ncbi:MAG TPA: FCD domain-containing protein [Propionicimonas sp.]|nr:FCD domain-containing protein [Propionicimonas sp.]
MRTGPERDTRTYEVVLRHVEAGILDGTYSAGGQLPPERELAATLDVGRSAVREALRVLQAQGLISSSTGRSGGTWLTPTRGDALARIFRLHLAVAGSGISELTETRVALERSSAASAAEQATGADLAELAELTERMRATADVDAFTDLDTDFHVAIAHCANSGLVADLTVAVREAVREPIRAAQERMADWEGFRLRLIQEHELIHSAIAGRDPERAAAAMDAHIRAAYAVLVDAGPVRG